MVNYDDSPSDAKPAGADVLEDLMLVHTVRLLRPLEMLLSVSTFVKVVKYVNQGCLHQCQVAAAFFPLLWTMRRQYPDRKTLGLSFTKAYTPLCAVMTLALSQPRLRQLSHEMWLLLSSASMSWKMFSLGNTHGPYRQNKEK